MKGPVIWSTGTYIIQKPSASHTRASSMLYDQFASAVRRDWKSALPGINEKHFWALSYSDIASQYVYE